MNLKNNNNLSTGLLITRCTVSILILFHGVANLFSGYAVIIQILKNTGLPGFLAYGVFFGEIVAPILILIGYRARLASLILAFNIFVAILLAHSKDVFALNQYGAWAIELQLFYMVIAISIFFTGAGDKALSTSSKFD